MNHLLTAMRCYRNNNNRHQQQQQQQQNWQQLFLSRSEKNKVTDYLMLKDVSVGTIQL